MLMMMLSIQKNTKKNHFHLNTLNIDLIENAVMQCAYILYVTAYVRACVY